MAWSRRCWYDGHWFASEKERDRYIELKLLEYAGEISDVVCQPQFALQPSFRDAFSGDRVAAITYTADFRYVEQGRVVVEEVKAERKHKKRTKRENEALTTEASRLRFKMAQYQNRDIEFRMVVK